MTKKEKEILKNLVNDPRGILSPSELINGVAKQDRRSIENLIAGGYIAEVPEHRTNMLGDKVIPNTYTFYRATEKGIIKFAPFYKKIWFNLKNNIPLYVGISSIILGALTIIISSNISRHTLQISLNGDNRADKEFQLKMRPYVIIDLIDTHTNLNNKSTEYTIYIKNVGALPAKITEESMDCINENQTQDKENILGKSAVVGNNQVILGHLNISAEKAECRYILKYQIAVDGFSDITYETSYIIVHKFGQSPDMQDAELK